MALKILLPGSAAVFALAAITANAHAGPIGGTASALVSAGLIGSNVQQVANRVCWSENGVRRCRSLNNVRVYGYRSPRAYGGQRVYGYQAPAMYGAGPPIGYGYLPARGQVETDPDVFPIGSNNWWQAMDALDRGGQGNGTGR